MSSVALRPLHWGCITYNYFTRETFVSGLARGKGCCSCLPVWHFPTLPARACPTAAWTTTSLQTNLPVQNLAFTQKWLSFNNVQFRCDVCMGESYRCELAKGMWEGMAEVLLFTAAFLQARKGHKRHVQHGRALAPMVLQLCGLLVSAHPSRHRVVVTLPLHGLLQVDLTCSAPCSDLAGREPALIQKLCNCG